MPQPVEDYYLRFLREQLGRYVSSASSSGSQDESLPPAANMGDPFHSNLPPSMGGPGSYPATNISNNIPTGGEGFPSDVLGEQPPPNIPQFGGGLRPGSPNDEFPLPQGETGGPVGIEDLANPPGPSGGTPPNNSRPPGNPPMYAGGGDRTPAGVNLNPADRVRIFFNNLGLPPPPTGYNPFGGLPSGFTENPNIGGGAPIFTPPGFSGPNWGPGGSIFSARGLPIVPGSTAGPGNLGGGGGSVESLTGKMFWHAAMPQFGGLTYAQVARMHPEWLPGLAHMGAGGEGSPAQKTGSGPKGVGQINAFAEGGVAGDEGSDFYSKIGATTYNAGRGIENTASNVFSALEKLGQFLNMSMMPPEPAPWGNAGAMPSAQDFLLGPGSHPSMDALHHWMMTPDVRPTGNPVFPPWPQQPPSYMQSSHGVPLLASNGAVSTDTVPAMLTPGEVVLDDQQQHAVMPVPGMENYLRPEQLQRLQK